MLRYSFIVFGLLSLVLMSCEKDNFNITEEILDETVPVIVEAEEASDFIHLIMPDGDTIELNGQALDGGGAIGVITTDVDSSYIGCGEGGGISIGPGPRDTSFFMVLTFDPSSGDPFLFVAGGVEVDEQEYAFASAICGHSTEVDITSLTDERIEGSYTGEFYMEPDYICANATSVGVIEVVFNLPLVPCE